MIGLKFIFWCLYASLNESQEETKQIFNVMFYAFCSWDYAISISPLITNASPLKMIFRHCKRHEEGSRTACTAAGCILRPAEWRERSEKFGCHSEVIKKTPQFLSCFVVSSMGGPDYCNWAQQLTEGRRPKWNVILPFQFPRCAGSATKHGGL